MAHLQRARKALQDNAAASWFVSSRHRKATSVMLGLPVQCMCCRLVETTYTIGGSFPLCNLCWGACHTAPDGSWLCVVADLAAGGQETSASTTNPGDREADQGDDRA